LSAKGLITQYEALKANPANEIHVGRRSSATAALFAERRNSTALIAAS